jgi:peptidoglycan/LPS O-acetylase OafA/YrhL
MPDERKHFGTLDGLRGVAAIAVVLFHLRERVNASTILPHAYLAVDFFFALSGFVVAHSYRRKLLDGLSTSSFMKIRLVRLYPLVLLGVSLGAINQLGHQFSSEAAHVSTSMFIIGVGYGLMAAPMYFPFEPAWGLYSMNLPSWSLLYEVLANWLFGWLGPNATTKLTLTICAISFASLVPLALLLDGVSAFEPTMLRWNVPAGLARVGSSFFLGVFIEARYSGALARRIRLSLLPASLLLLALFQVPIFPGRNAAFDLLFIAIASPLMVIAGANSLGTPRTRYAEDVLGRLSYPLYIVHLPIILLTFAVVKLAHLSDKLPVLLVALIALGAAFATAMVSEQWDARVRRWLTVRLIPYPRQIASAPN